MKLYLMSDTAAGEIETNAVVRFTDRELFVQLGKQKSAYSLRDFVIITFDGEVPTICFENNDDYLYVLSMIKKVMYS